MFRFRLVAILAGLLSALVFAAPSFADSIPLLSISPASSSITAGSAITLDVNISNVTDLYGFQFDLSFAPGILAANSVTEGAFLASGGSTFFLPGPIDNATGTISFTANSLFGPGPGVDGTGILATFVLTGITAGSSNVELSNVVLLDSNLNPLQVNLGNASVVVSPNVVPMPEPGSFMLSTLALGVLVACAKLRDAR